MHEHVASSDGYVAGVLTKGLARSSLGIFAIDLVLVSSILLALFDGIC